MWRRLSYDWKKSPGGTSSRVPSILGYLALIATIELVYIWVVSAATKGSWPGYMGYYDLLAEGFRAGHLHLALEPPPELLARENPFDVKNAEYWLGDASLYKGHFYFYWGPLPALLLAAVKTVFRIARPIGDQYLVFSFFSVSAVAVTLLLGEMRRRLFPRLPFPLFAVSVLACALGNPVPYLLASSSVYQAAISGGQAFLVLGLYFAFTTIRDDLDGPSPPIWRLAVAGAAWAGSIASRLSLAPAVFLLVLITALLAEAPSGDGRLRWFRVLRNAAFLACPVILGCMGLLVYNKLRFDSWLESGVSLQLTTWIFRFTPRYFPANIHQYLFRLPNVSCHFPYLLVPYEVAVSDVLPRWIPFRSGYVTPEPVAGMVWAFPLIWLAPISIAFGLGRIRRSRRAGHRDMGFAGQHPLDRTLVWCVISFAVIASVTLLAPLGLYMATMRYLGDIRFGVALLGTLGTWVLFARARHRWQRRLAIFLCGVVGVGAITAGMLLGYQGYTGHFQRFNPALSAKLDSWLSICRAP